MKTLPLGTHYHPANAKEAIAVLARLMLEHEIKSGGEIHLAYTQAVNAIDSFVSCLNGHLKAKAGI